MLELIKEKYKDYLYIESMPKDKSNVPLYVKHRFTMTEKAGGHSNLQLQQRAVSAALQEKIPAGGSRDFSLMRERLFRKWFG